MKCVSRNLMITDDGQRIVVLVITSMDWLLPVRGNKSLCKRSVMYDIVFLLNLYLSKRSPITTVINMKNVLSFSKTSRPFYVANNLSQLQ